MCTLKYQLWLFGVIVPQQSAVCRQSRLYLAVMVFPALDWLLEIQ